jgi:hypothetical protein
MLNEPRLITLQGRVISLSTAEYQKILAVLAVPSVPVTRPSLAEVQGLLNELRGKYIAGPSLTRALLNERRREREREEAKIQRRARPA